METANTPSGAGSGAHKLRLELATPLRVMVLADADSITFPGEDGAITVLPGHVHLVSKVGVGIVHYTSGNVTSFLSVSHGFAEVFQNHVRILVDTVEEPGTIDLERARHALERAREYLAGKSQEGRLDVERALRAEARALARIELALRAKNHSHP